MLKKYRLNDGSIDWYRIYFGVVPKWMTRYSPPFGDYNYAAYFYQPHRYIEDVYYKVKWFIQRGYRGYADCDAWSLYYYLAKWMPAALEQLRSMKHGTPMRMTPKGWATRLRIMQEGFEAVNAMNKLPSSIVHKILKQKMDKGLRLFAKHFLDLWD